MTPCGKHQKRIALLALGELAGQEAESLRAHIKQCRNCATYLDSLTNVTSRLASVELAPGIEPAESFHRNVVSRVRAAQPISIWAELLESLRAMLVRKSVALSTLGIAVVVILGMNLIRRPPVQFSSGHRYPEVALTLVQESRGPSTIAGYQAVAARSLDDFDDLLNRQAAIGMGRAPVITASTRSLPSALQ